MGRSNSNKQAAEAIATLILIAVYASALLIGGLSGLKDALIKIVSLLVAFGITAIACFAAYKSYLVARKKAGLICGFLAILPVVIWFVVKAPSHWIEKEATVISASASSTGGVKVTLQVNDIFSPQMVEFTVKSLGDVRTADKVNVWNNPLNPKQFSLKRQETDGGQKTWILFFSLLLAAPSFVLLASGSEWKDPGLEELRKSGANEDSCPPVQATKPAYGTAPEPLRKPDIATQIEAIDWFQFEKVCYRIMQMEGWDAKHIGGANPDGGVDITASMAGRNAVVQCKHWLHKQVDVKVVRELLGAKSSSQFSAGEAILFTTGELSQPAKDFAQSNGIVVRDRKSIESSIAYIGMNNFPELENPDVKFCPKCGSNMVWRDKARIPFWGCSRFPSCKGTIDGARG